MEEKGFYDEEALRARRDPSPSTVYAAENGYINPDDVVLDLGCGTGRDVYYLRGLGYEATGIDNNKKLDMIKIGKVMFDEDLPIYEGDMTATELPDDSVDVLFYNNSLHSLGKDRIEEALEEMERLAKPDARMVVMEFSEKTTNPRIRGHMDSNAMYAEELTELLSQRGYEREYLGEIKGDYDKVFTTSIYRIV